MADFKCEICGKTYVRQKHLINHTNHFHGEKSFKCLYCNKTFASLRNLTRHMKNQSCKSGKQVTVYACHICSDTFKSVTKLRVHFKRKHKSDSQKIKNKKKLKQTSITNYYDNDENEAIQHLATSDVEGIKDVFT